MGKTYLNFLDGCIWLHIKDALILRACCAFQLGLQLSNPLLQLLCTLLLLCCAGVPLC